MGEYANSHPAFQAAGEGLLLAGQLHSSLGPSHERVCTPAAGSCSQVRLGAVLTRKQKSLSDPGKVRPQQAQGMLLEAVPC